MGDVKRQCCFCGKSVGKWGNNPFPACTIKDAECCDDCNFNIVLPLRIMMATASNKEEKKNG